MSRLRRLLAFSLVTAMLGCCFYLWYSASNPAGAGNHMYLSPSRGLSSPGG